MAEKPKQASIKDMSFEDALAELEEIVRTLEDGGGSLDEAIAAYARGAELKKHCETKLTEAKAKVEKISLGPGGTVTLEPVERD
jgi:exodeoxyribonuclease VII small subunit